MSYKIVTLPVIVGGPAPICRLQVAQLTTRLGCAHLTGWAGAPTIAGAMHNRCVKLGPGTSCAGYANPERRISNYKSIRKKNTVGLNTHMTYR